MFRWAGLGSRPDRVVFQGGVPVVQADALLVLALAALLLLCLMVTSRS